MSAAVVCRRCVPVLIRAGADLNAQDVTNGWTPLVWSLKEGQAVSAKELIDAGSNPNLRDRNGKTALMHAADLGYKSSYQEVVQHLLTSGADLNIQDNDGQTALAHAERTAQLNPNDKRQAAVVGLLQNARRNQ
jgi:ankyrin repeat protein